MQKIKNDLPYLSKLFLYGNEFEQHITGHQVIIGEIFSPTLTEFDGYPVIASETTGLRQKVPDKPTRGLAVIEPDDDGDDDDLDLRRDNGVFLKKLTEDLEKSLRVPSQANRNLTELKSKAQILSQAKGNVFSDDMNEIVAP